MGMSARVFMDQHKRRARNGVGIDAARFGDCPRQVGFAGAERADQGDDDPGLGKLGDRAAQPEGVVLGSEVDPQTVVYSLHVHRRFCRFQES